MELVSELTKHHERVQAGKFDASRQPKFPWVTMQNHSTSVSPRFLLDALPAPRNDGVFTHPYRVETFTRMLTEVDGWGKGR